MELVTHIENSVENGIFWFTFCSLRQMYEGRLQILGIGKEINKIQRVLRYFPNAQEQNEAILVFEQGMHQMLKTSHQHKSHEDNVSIFDEGSKNCTLQNFFHAMGSILTLHFTRDASSSLCLPVSRY